MLFRSAEKEALAVEVDELKTSLSNVKARIFECAGYYTWKMKAEMMEEFKAGKHVNWTPDEDIAQFNTAFPEDYIPLVPLAMKKTLRRVQLQPAPMPRRWRHQAMANKGRMQAQQILRSSSVPPPQKFKILMVCVSNNGSL